MFVICADDFGQNAFISEGILQLLELHRLQAVSCMVTEPACAQYAQQLLAFKPQVQIGLHLNLTHGQAALWQRILQAYHLWPRSLEQLRTEIRCQIEQFKRIFGFFPDFIDGHQHIHQLPGVADQLLDVVTELKWKPWFRSTYHRWIWRSPKKIVLYVLGGHRFYRLLIAKGFSTNQAFAGDYLFSTKLEYRTLFLQAISSLGNDGLLMCHPGLESDDIADPIRRQRWAEFQYLASEAFLQDWESRR